MFFIPWASPPLVKTAIHWPNPSTFTKVGKRERAKASLLASGSSTRKSNSVSSALRLRAIFWAPEANISSLSFLVSSVKRYKITWDIFLANIYTTPARCMHCCMPFLTARGTPNARDVDGSAELLSLRELPESHRVTPMKHEIFRRLSRCFGLKSNFISFVTSRSYFCARNKSIAGDVASRLLLFFEERSCRWFCSLEGWVNRGNTTS